MTVDSVTLATDTAPTRPAKKVAAALAPLQLSGEHHLCPGCGHPVAWRLLLEVISELDLAQRAIGVVGHGCYTNIVQLADIDFLQCLHGRAPAVATGVKRVQPQAAVFTLQGDGDVASEGLAEVLHAAARGERITTIMLNNGVFGDTGGQMTAASVVGQRTKTSLDGRAPDAHGYPVPVAELIASMPGVAYVARGAVNNAGSVAKTKRYLKRAFELSTEGAGYTFVEVLTMCPTGWFLPTADGPDYLSDTFETTYPLGVLKQAAGVGALRFGIVLPVVFRYPGTFAPWESDGGIAELRRIAEAADRFGFTHLTCSDHVGVPEPVAEVRGGTYWDPLATLGYLAACTRRIGLATNVLVLGYHHPLEIAKRYGTLDVVSGGRLILGLGVGTLEEEFALLGAPFADRGARADDAIAALRASLGVRVPTYHGPFYDFEGFVIEPHAVQSRVPLWIGGKTKRSLRRAVTLADGWVPTALSVAQMGEMLKSFDLPPGFEVVLGPPKPLDPMGEPDEAVATVERLQGIGTTIVHSTFVHHSPEHYIEQLEALAKLFGLSPTA